MPATTEGLGDYPAVRNERHPDCWVCAPGRTDGLAVEFTAGADGSVEGEFDCRRDFTGYPGFLHGGVAATLLDGAMTNCLMARGTPGLTARLEIRYRHPVLIGEPILVRGWREGARGPLHMLGAEIVQKGRVVVTATARFMEYPEQDAEAT